MRLRWTGILLVLLLPAGLFAQDDKQLAPVTRTYAITNVTIIQGPGRKIDKGTVVIKDGLITSVGATGSIPPEAIVIKADSMFLYAGFIDGLTRAGVIKPKEEPNNNRERVKDPGNPTPERAGINPQVDVRTSLNPADKALEDLRNAGFTTAQVAPYGNLFPGQAAIVLTGAASADKMVLLSKSSMYSELTGAGGVYPATILGVMAKWREVYRQATLTKSYEGLYASNRAGIERPALDRNLEALYPVIDQRMPVIFKSEKFLDAYKVFKLRDELGFTAVIADLKDATPVVNNFKSSKSKVFLSLDLPEEVKKDDKKDDKDKKDSKDAKKEEPAKAKTAAEVEKEGLDKRRAESIASYAGQAAAFQKAGITFGFSSLSVKSKDIPANLRRMIAAGLTEDQALAALTTSPAQLLGLSDRMGTVDNGKMANLVITDKSYFNEKSKVRYVFVDGVMYKMDVKETKEAKKGDGTSKAEAAGTWSMTTESPQGNTESKLTIKKDGSNLSGTMSGGRMPGPVDLKDVSLDGNSLSFNYTLTFGGNSIKVEVALVIDGDTMKGSSTVGNFGSFPTEGTRDPKN